jgi:hypothetical protein
MVVGWFAPADPSREFLSADHTSLCHRRPFGCGYSRPLAISFLHHTHGCGAPHDLSAKTPRSDTMGLLSKPCRGETRITRFGNMPR